MPPHLHQSSSVPTSAFLVPSTRFPVCIFCQQPHLESKCNTVVDPESRRRVLRRARHCFNCLQKNHLSRNCQSMSRCKQCQGKHQTSICDKEAKSRDGRASTTNLDPEAPSFIIDNTTSTLCSNQCLDSFVTDCTSCDL